MYTTSKTTGGRAVTLSIVLAVGLVASGCAKFEGVRAAFTGEAASSEAGDVPTPYDRGKRYLAAGHYGLAVEYFRMALLSEPQSVEILNALAATYDKLGRFDVSKRYYDRALILAPNAVQTLNNYGYSLLMQKQHRLALGVLSRVAKADGDAVEKEMGVANLRLATDRLTTVDENKNTKAMASAEKTVADEDAKEEASRIWIERVGVAQALLHTRPGASLAHVKWNTSPGAVNVLPKGVPDILKTLTGIFSVSTDEPNRTIKVNMPMAIAESPSSSQPGAPVIEKTVARRGLVGKVPVLEVSNGAGRLRLAARFRAFLREKEVNVKRLTNAKTFSHERSEILYRRGYGHYAQYLAKLLPVQVVTRQIDQQFADIRIVLGGDVLAFDRNLIQREGRI